MIIIIIISNNLKAKSQKMIEKKVSNDKDTGCDHQNHESF